MTTTQSMVAQVCEKKNPWNSTSRAQMTSCEDLGDGTRIRLGSVMWLV